jgi:hypothetical protein
VTIIGNDLSFRRPYAALLMFTSNLGRTGIEKHRLSKYGIKLYIKGFSPREEYST